MVAGAAAGQILVVAATPLLTRLYSPAEFGLLAVFSAIAATLSVISCGRYDLAVALPEDDRDAADLVSVFATATVVAAVQLFWAAEIGSTLGAPDLAGYLWLLPVAVMLVGLYQVFSKWAARQRRYRHIATTRVTQAIGTIVIQLGGHRYGTLALIAGQAGGQGLGAFGLAGTAIRQGALASCSIKGIRKQAARYRDFPI
jgi:O-antigen/teichoic acid export membrane protein